MPAITTTGMSRLWMLDEEGPCGESVVSGFPPFWNTLMIRATNSTITTTSTNFEKMRTNFDRRPITWSPRNGERGPRSVPQRAPGAPFERRNVTSDQLRHHHDRGAALVVLELALAVHGGGDASGDHDQGGEDDGDGGDRP